MLNKVSRRRSAVGRIASDLGATIARPRNRPPTMRISGFRARGSRAGPAIKPPPHALARARARHVAARSLVRTRIGVAMPTALALVIGRLGAKANQGHLAALAIRQHGGLAAALRRSRFAALGARATELAAHGFAFVAPDVLLAAVALAWFMHGLSSTLPPVGRVGGEAAGVGVVATFAGGAGCNRFPPTPIASASLRRSTLPARGRVTLRLRFGVSHNRPGELRACFGGELFTELLAQMPGRHFLDRALPEFAELEWSIGHA